MFGDFLNLSHWFDRHRNRQQDNDAGDRELSDSDGAESAPLDDQVITYSRRLLSPFSGQIQIAELANARAISIDGTHWEIQYCLPANPGENRFDLQQPKKQYILIGLLTADGLARKPLPPFFDPHTVSLAIDQLLGTIADTELPYLSVDHMEYWLLDQSGHQPLALLDSCIAADDIGAPMLRPSWMAMPAAQLPVEQLLEHSDYVAPVNSQLESLIAERAGPSPRAEWFDRNDSTSIHFPPCLIREDWDNEEDRLICQRYIHRLSPRLLTLQGLNRDDRQRLEQASSAHALDVDRFFPLYPEVIDHKQLRALRVEAELRRSSRT